MFRFRVFVTILTALVVMAVAYGFAAANTVPASYAGDGSGGVSGYNITNIHYTLNAADPANVDSVSFTLDNPATSVSVQGAGGGSWYSCNVAGGTSVTCTTTGLSAVAATSLRVVSAQ